MGLSFLTPYFVGATIGYLVSSQHSVWIGAMIFSITWTGVLTLACEWLRSFFINKSPWIFTWLMFGSLLLGGVLILFSGFRM